MSAAHGSTALGRSVPRQRLGSVVAAVVTVGLLSGCTSSAEPTPLPEPTDPTSPSASASATPPTLPPEAEGTSPRAAKAFARHYVDLINYAARTGDTQDLRKLGAPGCVSCKAIASNIEKIYNAGGHIESHGWKVTVVSTVPAQPHLRPILDLGVVQSPESVVRAAGQSPTSFPGGKKPMTMYLVRSGPTWQVKRIDLVRS